MIVDLISQLPVWAKVIYVIVVVVLMILWVIPDIRKHDKEKEH